MRWLVVVVAAVASAGCRPGPDAPPSQGSDRAQDRAPAVPALPAVEVKRSQDACKAYVERVCACAETVPALKQRCALAQALPEAIQIALDVRANADSTRRDVLHVNDSVRKIAKQCIEDTARLPTAGCP
jgi:hypothetical protein